MRKNDAYFHREGNGVYCRCSNPISVADPAEGHGRRLYGRYKSTPEPVIGFGNQCYSTLRFDDSMILSRTAVINAGAGGAGTFSLEGTSKNQPFCPHTSSLRRTAIF
jgi:hypothetical protein